MTTQNILCTMYTYNVEKRCHRLREALTCCCRTNSNQSRNLYDASQLYWYTVDYPLAILVIIMRQKTPKNERVLPQLKDGDWEVVNPRWCCEYNTTSQPQSDSWVSTNLIFWWEDVFNKKAYCFDKLAPSLSKPELIWQARDNAGHSCFTSESNN